MRPADEETPEGDAPDAGTITAIKQQVRDPERMNLFLDGAFALGLAREVVAKEGLAVGEYVTPARMSSLKAYEEISSATNAALRLLSERPRTEREIRDRLKRKAYSTEAIDQAVATLDGWGYLDDAQFARMWVANREAHRPRGERLLSQELWQKGVGKEVIAETLGEAEIDERAGALGVAQGRMKSLASLEPAVAKRRLAAFLGRRGYGYGVVKSVVDEVFGAQDVDEAADGDEDHS